MGDPGRDAQLPGERHAKRGRFAAGERQVVQAAGKPMRALAHGSWLTWQLGMIGIAVRITEEDGHRPGEELAPLDFGHGRGAEAEGKGFVEYRQSVASGVRGERALDERRSG